MVTAAHRSQWKSPESVHASMTAAAEVNRGKHTFLSEDTGPKEKISIVLAGTDGDLFQKFFILLMSLFCYLLVKRAGVRFYQKQGNECY